MKKNWLAARTGLALACALAAGMFVSGVSAQPGAPRKPLPSPYAETLQRIGVADVKVEYHRPAVKGREIWGTKLAEYDKPWRAGANDTTAISFEKDVTIEGQALAAGAYGLHIIPSADKDWVVIFNKTAKSWGSYTYKEADDALRVSVKPQDAPMQERLTYGFEDLTDTSAVAYMHWEKKKIAFKIEVAQ